MHKEELINLHQMLYDVKLFFEGLNPDLKFPQYNALKITPSQQHKSKMEHKYAIFVRGKEIANAMKEVDYSSGYETLEKDGVLPLLAPMSEIAGRMAPLMGAYFSQRIHGGNGTLSSGATGVRPCKTIILGAGSVGTNAARIAVGMCMEVVVMNRGIERLHRIDELFMGRVKTLPLTDQSIREEIKDADIVVGAVLVPGGKTPVLVSQEMLKTMKQGSVIVDVAIDQGGCAETSRPTTHNAPIFETDGIIHYCVANMPGAYPRISTLALTNATLPYIKTLSKEGIQAAIRKAPDMRSAINTFGGHVVNRPLASALDLPYREFI